MVLLLKLKGPTMLTSIDTNPSLPEKPVEDADFWREHIRQFEQLNVT